MNEKTPKPEKKIEREPQFKTGDIVVINENTERSAMSRVLFIPGIPYIVHSVDSRGVRVVADTTHPNLETIISAHHEEHGHEHLDEIDLHHPGSYIAAMYIEPAHVLKSDVVEHANNPEPLALPHDPEHHAKEPPISPKDFLIPQRAHNVSFNAEAIEAQISITDYLQDKELVLLAEKENNPDDCLICAKEDFLDLLHKISNHEASTEVRKEIAGKTMGIHRSNLLVGSTTSFQKSYE